MRNAGVPASRCSHAFVEVNGRDLGLYVVKEAFSKDFLGYFYNNTDGDLWDGGFVREIDESTEKDVGDPTDKAAIPYATAAAALGWTEGAVRVTVHRLRRRYRELLRDEIMQTLADPAQADEELKALMGAFAEG